MAHDGAPYLLTSAGEDVLSRTKFPPGDLFCNPFAICQYLLSVTWNITQDKKPYARGISLLGPHKKVLHPGGLKQQKRDLQTISQKWEA